MAEPISRLISGTASMSIPPEWLEYREVYLSTAVVRKPTNPYLNKNFSPDKGKYGNVTILASGLYVREELPINYELQYHTIFSLQPSQNFLALICALEAILQTFVNLANAIPDTVPITKNNPIENWSYLAPNVDRVVINCYADTALFVSLIPVEMERCDPADGEPSPPPPPPPPPPPIPPGTPIDGENGNPLLDPPQEGEPPEFDNPFDGDRDEPISPFPLGDVCVGVRIYYNFFANGVDVFGGELFTDTFAPIVEFEYAQGQSGLDFNALTRCEDGSTPTETPGSVNLVANVDAQVPPYLFVINRIINADSEELLDTPLEYEG